MYSKPKSCSYAPDNNIKVYTMKAGNLVCKKHTAIETVYERSINRYHMLNGIQEKHEGFEKLIRKPIRTKERSDVDAITNLLFPKYN